VYFDGRWNLLDGDLGPVYLLRDNATIASEFDLVRDHDLVKRSHPYGMLDPDRRSDRELHAAAFVSEKEPAADRAIADIVRSSTMSLTLRPGEALVWRWGAGGSPKYHGNAEIRTWGPRTAGGRTWGASAADRICNGRWEYRPDFGREGWRKGAERVENVVVERGGLASGTVVWRMRSPYVFVGGRVESAGGARLFLSWDGVDWKPVGESLDPFFPSRGPARYEYRLKCDVPAGARLDRLAVLNDVQMAPLALPGMVLGENRFAYTDRTPGPRKVRLTHEWVERSLHRPPGAPTVPRVSQEGGLRFEWRAPEGEAAADYHFELSDRADFAWPLSSNFEKLIGNTADRGSARYRVPSGLLAPGRTYLWRVRAQSAAGVWGPWSEAWTFTAGGPATPTEVRLEGRILRWKGGAARYRVYGSDERGFSASDEPYDVEVGRSKEVPSRALSNFIAETAETELVVLGTANKAFYRVVAVDERGNRSGPSDYASAPRPFFTREPSPSAKVGVAYRDQVSVIRSLGDLRLQWVDEAEVPGFWDVERPRFAIGKGPAWLRIDPRTGALEGVPDAAGTFDVEVVATLERTVRRLRDPGPRPWNLGLGKDPTDALVAEKAGEATHRFRIVVE
jgi:hypothetical protein